MNRHNGFVTCRKCGCVTRVRKTYWSPDTQAGTLRWDDGRPSYNGYACLFTSKCDHQRAIKTERDRRLHAALRAREDRDLDRQMAMEMGRYFTGMS